MTVLGLCFCTACSFHKPKRILRLSTQLWPFPFNILLPSLPHPNIALPQKRHTKASSHIILKFSSPLLGYTVYLEETLSLLLHECYIPRITAQIDHGVLPLASDEGDSSASSTNPQAPSICTRDLLDIIRVSPWSKYRSTTLPRIERF